MEGGRDGDKKLFQICWKWDMYKLGVYIYIYIYIWAVYLSLKLQNHKGFGIRWSWRDAKKISKLPSSRGLQKNHAHLQFYKRFPCKLKMLWVWFWLNFKITLVREYPVEQNFEQFWASIPNQTSQVKQARQHASQATQASRANQAS